MVHSAKAVIVTFAERPEYGRIQPALSEGKQTAAARGQTGLGAKLWIKVKGKWDRFVAFGAEDWPINFVQSEYFDEDTTTLVAFGPDGHAVDVEDTDAAQAVLRKLVPGIEVLEITGHSWVGDDFAKSTWPMHYTGYLSESLEEMQRPEGNVFLAGSDYANGLGGFMTGPSKAASPPPATSPPNSTKTRKNSRCNPQPLQSSLARGQRTEWRKDIPSIAVAVLDLPPLSLPSLVGLVNVFDDGRGRGPSSPRWTSTASAQTRERSHQCRDRPRRPQ